MGDPHLYEVSSEVHSQIVRVSGRCRQCLWGMLIISGVHSEREVIMSKRVDNLADILELDIEAEVPWRWYRCSSKGDNNDYKVSKLYNWTWASCLCYYSVSGLRYFSWPPFSFLIISALRGLFCDREYRIATRVLHRTKLLSVVMTFEEIFLSVTMTLETLLLSVSSTGR